MAELLVDIPAEYMESGLTLMSNFDHVIHEEVVKHLEENNEHAEYPGWNFFAKVWYNKQEKLWYGKVMCYGSHVNTITGESPDELRREISNEYGYD